jgi:hypothetical protein
MNQLEAEQTELNPEVSEQLDTGLLMSFLSDFRSAEYEQIRKQREEELAKTRKRGPRRPVVPESDEETPEGYYEADDPVYETPDAQSPLAPHGQEEWAPPPPPQPEGQWAPPPPQPGGQWAPPPPPGPDQVNGADFLTAASQPVEPEGPGRKLRLPFGLAGSKSVRQSPATT